MLEGLFTNERVDYFGTGSMQDEYIETQCHSTAVTSEKLHVMLA